MQHKIYKQSEDNEGLILYFNGWAMTPEAVEHLLLPKGYDLIVVWDYRDEELRLSLSQYKYITLVAWSMGVWAVHRLRAWLSSLPIEKSIAVCGTGYPMDDRWGIPVDIFRGTLEAITPDNRTRFNRRMCGGKSHRHLLEALERRSTEEIRQELESVYRYEVDALHSEVDPDVWGWDLAHIGTQDRIIPRDNQCAYWNAQGIATREHDAHHYLFGQYSLWEELWS